MKKALIIQSLFFCALLSAQDLYFESPKANDPLEDVQEFVIGVGAVAPTRMEFYLNGRLKLARKKAPFHFKIRWNTSMENRVKVIAWFQEGEPVVLEKTFAEIKTDFKQEVQAFHCFPFLDKPLPAKWSFRSQGEVMEPQNFESANQFPLNLVIALDISGSMKFDLPELSKPLHNFLAHAREKGYEVELLLFDSIPRSLDPQQAPKQLEKLYNGVPESVIWDALATGTGFFKDSPRRVVLLISDGNDDGSVHGLNSAGLYFRETYATLIWMNPSTFQNRQLGQLVALSGGFRLEGKHPDNWDVLKRRLEHQYYLLAPEAKYPITLKISPGAIWHPKWNQ